jgi:hypothetical protein
VKIPLFPVLLSGGGERIQRQKVRIQYQKPAFEADCHFPRDFRAGGVDLHPVLIVLIWRSEYEHLGHPDRNGRLCGDLYSKGMLFPGIIFALIPAALVGWLVTLIR